MVVAMLQSRWLYLALVCLAVSSGAVADGTLAGTWEGPYNLSIDCEPGTPTPANGRARVVLRGPDEGLIGIAILTNVPWVTDVCVPGELITLAFPVAGSLRDGEFSGAVMVPGEIGFVAGPATASRLALLWLGDNQGTIDLQRIGDASSASDLSGTFSGTWTWQKDVSDECTNMTVLPQGGAVRAVVVQDGDAVVATLLLEGVKSVDSDSTGPCSVREGGALDGMMTAARSGTALEGMMLAGDAGVPFRATASPAKIIGTGNGEGAGFSFTIDRTTVADVPEVSGTYIGTYSSTDDYTGRCANFDTLSYGGDVVVQIAQAGTIVSGTVTTLGAIHPSPASPLPAQCSQEEAPPQVARFAGTFDGATVTGVLEGPELRWSGVLFGVDRNRLSADLRQGVQRWTAGASRASGTAPNAVMFKPLRPIAQAGGETTLAWSIYNAASVIIDQGIGPQPAVGSVTVRPSATTTYTLTAIGPAATTTVTTTVVVGPQRRRRSARH